MATTHEKSRDTGIADIPVSDSVADVVAALQRLPAADIERVKDAVIKLGDASKPNVECCPRCGGKAIVRNGHKHGKQAYLCKGCGKSFVSTTNTIMYKSHRPTSDWLTVISDTLEGNSLVSTASKIGARPRTAFFMRHKVLMALEAVVEADAVSDEALGDMTTVLEQDSLDSSVDAKSQTAPVVQQPGGVYELDETYTPDSYKGARNLGQLVDRPARKHGGTAQKPGLSNEQICICAAVRRDGSSYAKAVNRAKPSNAELQEALAEHLPPDSLAITDGATGYGPLCVRRHCSWKDVNLVPQEERKVYNLNTVNNFHSMIKERLRRYRGVSTKYINRYNALFSKVFRRKWTTFDDICKILLAVNGTPMSNTYSDVQLQGLLAI